MHVHSRKEGEVLSPTEKTAVKVSLRGQGITGMPGVNACGQVSVAGRLDSFGGGWEGTGRSALGYVGGLLGNPSTWEQETPSNA